MFCITLTIVGFDDSIGYATLGESKFSRNFYQTSTVKIFVKNNFMVSTLFIIAAEKLFG